MSPRNRVLDRAIHWRHLANTVEQLCRAARSDVDCSKLTVASLVNTVSVRLIDYGTLIALLIV